MKFRVKITITILILLALTFGIGGSLLIAQSFSNSMDRARSGAKQAYQMAVGLLRFADEMGAEYGESSGNILTNLSTQAGWSALSLTRDGTALFETGDTTLLGSAPECPDEGKCAVNTTRGADGKQYLLLTGWVRQSAADRITFAVDVTGIYQERQTQETMYRQVFAALVAAGAVVSWIVAYLLTRPLGVLSRASRELAKGNLAYRAEVRTGDEVARLADDFNKMAQRLEESVSDIQQSMAKQERFMADFSHEMKTPMTSIIGYADLLRSQVLSPAEQMDAANYIFSEGKRLEALSLKLLDMLSLDYSKLQLVRASPSALVAGLAEHLKPMYAQKHIQLQYRCTDGACMLEPDLFKTLIVNLMDNARKALDNGGNIYILQEMLPDGCRVRVLDNGRGIPPDALEHLTEAFYRVDKSRSRAQGGAGLGLSLCNEIVRLHGGTMQFESRVGNGTVVTVELKGGRV